MYDEHPKCKVQTIEYIIDTHDQKSNDWNFAMNSVITKNEMTEKKGDKYSDFRMQRQSRHIVSRIYIANETGLSSRRAVKR